MRMAGLQKLTLLDFPEHTAATVFVPGCNLRCPFCHNAELVRGPHDPAGDTPIEEFFAFLEKRHGLLDGICITGGEPLLESDLADFCARIKSIGFAVKLDTNGSFPNRLRDLVEAGLVDYIAMDVKNAPERYAETVGVPGFDLAPIAESINYLLTGVMPYEFRTTVVREFHTEAGLLALSQWIAGAQAWYLQNFVDAATVLAGPGTLHAWEADELQALLPTLRQAVPNAQLRGV